MPLPRDQHRTLEEIVSRARRTYRQALKMQTEQAIDDDALATMYVDTALAAAYTEVLWRQSGDRAREEAHARHERADPLPEPPAPVPPREDLSPED